MGAEQVKALSWFHPNDPILDLDPAVDSALLFEPILELYNAYRRPVRFEPEDFVASAGHNEYGAWGLTVFRTDAEDLYVYRTNPDNPDQYWYKGAWETMRIIRDTIPVKGQEPVIVDHKYTRHGPVLYENPDKQQACAMRCGWLEIGGSPYLASLRMGQAHNFEAFREACSYKGP